MIKCQNIMHHNYIVGTLVYPFCDRLVNDAFECELLLYKHLLVPVFFTDCFHYTQVLHPGSSPGLSIYIINFYTLTDYHGLCIIQFSLLICMFVSREIHWHLDYGIADDIYSYYRYVCFVTRKHYSYYQEAYYQNSYYQKKEGTHESFNGY